MNFKESAAFALVYLKPLILCFGRARLMDSSLLEVLISWRKIVKTNLWERVPVLGRRKSFGRSFGK